MSTQIQLRNPVKEEHRNSAKERGKGLTVTRQAVSKTTASFVYHNEPGHDNTQIDR